MLANRCDRCGHGDCLLSPGTDLPRIPSRAHSVGRSDRIFRAMGLHKAAHGLHMLRRPSATRRSLPGYGAFTSSGNFKKAGTNDFRRAMEQTSGRDLERFFETWFTAPRFPAEVSYHVTGAEAVVRFEQRAEAVASPSPSRSPTRPERPRTSSLSCRTNHRALAPAERTGAHDPRNGDNGALVEGGTVRFRCGSCSSFFVSQEPRTKNEERRTCMIKELWKPSR